MSTISASTLTTTALQYTADTTGALVFQTGATPTTALTLAADQSATFTGTVNFATAGFTNLSYTGTLTGGTGVVNIGSGQFYKAASGYVGIWTTSTGTYLQINGTHVSGQGLLTLNAASGTQYTSLTFQNNSVSKAYLYYDYTNSLLNLYGAAGQAVVLTTNDTERMRIISSGYVGIGVTNPDGQLTVVTAQTANSANKIKIQGYQVGFEVLNAAQTQNWYFGNADADSNKLYIGRGYGVGQAIAPAIAIATSDNVGIGTTTIAYKLSVNGDIRTVGSVGQVGLTQGNATNSGYVSFWDAAGTTRSGYIGYATLSGSGNFVISSDLSTNNMTFQTNAIERMRVANNGYVGVGTTAPSGIFDAQVSGVTRILAGYNGTSANYYDADTHNFRNAAATGTLTIGSTGNITLPYANSSILNSSGRKMLNQTGGILQIVQTVNTTRSATACVNGGTDMPGMSVTITPSSTSSKILVLINIAFNAPENENLVGLLLRNGTLINQSTTSPGVPGFFGIATANDGNYHMWSASGCYLDSPASTSALTYKLQGGGCNGTRTLYLNGTGRNSSTDALGSSSITVMEIAG